MINISFDNPYLLLLALPLLALVIVPYAIAIRRDNRNKSVITSLVLHIVMALCIAFAAAGMDVTAIMTKTQVYVVADVSYSSKAKLDTVDEYIRTVEEEMPSSAQMGVVCFGRDYDLHTRLGGVFRTVKNARVDDSATNIALALDYTGTLFETGAIKRLVLITDGKETNDDETLLAEAVKRLYMQGVRIHVMYLDTNPDESVKEVQISDVDFLSSTYQGVQTTANVLVQSSYEAQAFVTLHKGDEEIKKAVSLDVGYNIVNFDLDTDEAAINDYKITVEAAEDASDYNNEYLFTQTVAQRLKVLAITSLGLKDSRTQKTALAELYGAETQAQEGSDNSTKITVYRERAEIDYRRLTDTANAVPCSVEELCEYDEIVLANVDVRATESPTALVNNLHIAVSTFGKTLITIGDVEIQNSTDDTLSQLDDMLPVKFGNNDDDPKLLGIVIDVSRSMYQADRVYMAKEAAKSLIELMGENDEVTLVSFSAAGKVEIEPTDIKTEEDKQEIFDTIDGLEPWQGTYIGDGLHEVYTTMQTNASDYSEMQVMLLSDGLNYSGEVEHDPLDIAKKLYNELNAPVSVINTGCDAGATTLQMIAGKSYGHGNYYYVKTPADLQELMMADVADDMLAVIVEEPSAVHVNKAKDDVLDGVFATDDVSFKKVNGYVNSKKKNSAITVLTVDYTKPNGTTVQSPLYAYWKYGNGKVCTFTSTISGSWATDFMDESGTKFAQNLLTNNTPEEKNDYPYTLAVEFDGANIAITAIPGAIDPRATLTVQITNPDGTARKAETITFYKDGFFGEFAVSAKGRYTVQLTYAFSGASVTDTVYFNLSYSDEYDAFAPSDAAYLHSAVRNMGTVTLDGTVSLENDKNEQETYFLEMTAFLMAAAVLLFVVDVAIRRLKWDDIVGLFVKKSKTNGKGGQTK